MLKFFWDLYGKRLSREKKDRKWIYKVGGEVKINKY